MAKSANRKSDGILDAICIFASSGGEKKLLKYYHWRDGSIVVVT